MESSSYFISFVSPDNNLRVVLHIHNISNYRWLPKACCVLKVSPLEIVKSHYLVTFTLQPRVETSQLFMTIKPQDNLVHSLGDPILPGGIGQWDQTDRYQNRHC